MSRLKIISIHSFRGGTGKSNLTANLASQVALSGHRVGVFDTDIASPGIHVPFGLSDKTMGRTLNQFLRSECEIDQVAFNVGEHVGDAPGRRKLVGAPLWLVPSSINSHEISRVLRDGYDMGRLNEGLNGLSKKLNLDYLFIDTHPGLGEETLLSLAISDIVLLILRPDQQDFQGTAVTVDVATGLDVPNLLLVINKVLPRYDFAALQRDAEEQYGQPVVGVLPLDEDLMDMQSADIFSLRFPDHPWSQVVRKIAEHVIEA
jgi:MinD-like ATPase involved in chromosome partitioning or flagellar assembly